MNCETVGLVGLLLTVCSGLGRLLNVPKKLLLKSSKELVDLDVVIPLFSRNFYSFSFLPYVFPLLLEALGRIFLVVFGALVRLLRIFSHFSAAGLSRCI